MSLIFGYKKHSGPLIFNYTSPSPGSVNTAHNACHLSALIIQGRFPGRGKVIFSGFGHFALLAEPARAGFVAEWTEIMDLANRQG